MWKKSLIFIIFALAVLGGKNLQLSVNTGVESAQKEPISQPRFIKNSQTNLVTVTRVVDGDTIIVDTNGAQEKIRLIGVDTPETVDPRKPVQCFGKEASLFTKNLLEGREVRLESDSSQGDRDKYGRLLRYVFLEGGTFINREIIAQGYGHEYTYRTPYQYQADFKTAERRAQETHRGLWSPDACNQL